MKQYFEILELQPGATPAEVKTAYRDLAKVWHPDRFRSDSPRLKSKAAEKLSEINEAYEKIRAYQARQKARKQAGENQRPSAGDTQNHTGYRPYSPETSPEAGQSFSGYSRPTPNGRPQHRRPSGSSARSQSSTYRRPRTHSASRARPSGNGTTGRSSKQSAHSTSQSSFQQTQTPTHTLARRRQTSVQHGAYGHNYTYAYKKRRRAKNSMAIYLAAGALFTIIIAGIIFFLKKNDTETPSLATWTSSAEATEQVSPEARINDSAASSASDAEVVDTIAPVEITPSATQNNYSTRKLTGNEAPAGFFTIGSTKAEVEAVQGKPEQIMNELFRYGFSSIYFEDNIVIGWHQSPDTRLKVHLSPKKTYDATFFTKGSTRDEVLAIQGTPDHYRDRGRELRYGESRITFEKGRVSSWHQHPDSPLKAKLLPKIVSKATHFTYKSTRDEVLSVQGTPTHFGENSFHYGYSTVQFKDNRVIGWNQVASSPLRILLEPTNPTSTKFFTKGSTRDEVIAAQGTPDQYSERIFKYGHSSISFEKDRVVSWYESAASPLKARSK